MNRRLEDALRAWDRFWFKFDHPLGLALARIQLASVLVWLAVSRQLGSMQWYRDDGLVPRALALNVMPEAIRPPFAWFFWPDSMSPWVHGLYLFACVMVLLGVRARGFAAFAWIVQMGFIQRNYAVLFGADVISCLFLFYLVFTRCDDRLSLLNWRRPRREREVSSISSAFARLWQIQLAVIYAYTGFEKLKGASWWDGTALWTVMGNPQMVIGDMSWLRNLPLVISIIVFSTIVFEIYWPAAVVIPSLRKWWLGAGVLFHSGIAVLMNLWTFSLIMLSPYWLFLKPGEVDRLFVSIRDFRARVFSVSRVVR